MFLMSAEYTFPELEHMLNSGDQEQASKALTLLGPELEKLARQEAMDVAAAPRASVVAVFAGTRGHVLETPEELRGLLDLPFMEVVHRLPFGRTQPFVYVRFASMDDSLFSAQDVMRDIASLHWEHLGFFTAGKSVIYAYAPADPDGEDTYSSNYKGPIHFG